MWKEACELYCIASDADKNNERLHTTLFLHVAGEEAVEEYNTFRQQIENASLNEAVGDTLCTKE